MDLTSAERAVTDQMGRRVTVSAVPKRIVSLVPSQTELLFDLGLDKEIVGVTRYCVHPAEAVRRKRLIGGTKRFQFDVIESLEPDLIIGNKEENYEEGIERLAKSHTVWMSDVRTMDDALEMIREVGALVRKARTANELAAAISMRFAALDPLGSQQQDTGRTPGVAGRTLRVAYVIWQRPIMVAGANTFIDDMLVRCGFVNAFSEELDGQGSRYPQVTEDDLHGAGLDHIFLASEPFPFGPKQREAFAKRFPQASVRLVDGQMFSWYGSRLLKAASYLAGLMAEISQEGIWAAC